MRNTYHEKLEKSKSIPYERDRQRNIELTENVAKNYVMAHLSVAMNTMTAAEQKNMKLCAMSTNDKFA